MLFKITLNEPIHSLEMTCFRSKVHAFTKNRPVLSTDKKETILHLAGDRLVTFQICEEFTSIGNRTIYLKQVNYEWHNKMNNFYQYEDDTFVSMKKLINAGTNI